jgi:hypothetical protein
MSIDWTRPWEEIFFDDSLPEHAANIDEAIYERVMWHDPDDKSEELMAFCEDSICILRENVH